MNKRYVISRRFLIFWTLFIGIGAVIGALMMFLDKTGETTGMSGMIPYFQVLPFADVLFQNLIFSGVMLLIVNGISNLISAGLLFCKKKAGIITGMIFGLTLMLWIIIQFIIFPLNFMSTSFFVFGFLQFLTGYICLVGYKQSQFSFKVEDYKNIGKDKTKLVVFFSREGYTKKIAYEIANKQGAEILEIKPTERIVGNLGFWWCGRFGMLQLGMEYEESDLDLSTYNEVTICSPVWVFGISAPIRQFCLKYKGKLKNVKYVLTHFMNCKFYKIATEMDKLLESKHIDFKSYRCRFGEVKLLNK